MADNDKNNMSGDSRVPKSTKGLEGSVSLEDLKKYHLIDTGDENTPTNNTVSDDKTSNEGPTPAKDFDLTPAGDHLQTEESNDHLSESKQDESTDHDTNFVPVPPVTSKESVDDSQAQPESKSEPEENPEEDVKPWEKSFDSDTDEQGHVSRAVSKEKQRGNHTLVVTLVIALIVIMFTPVIINAVRGSGSGDLDSAQSESSVENKDKSTKKKSNKKASTKKKAAKKSTKKSSVKKSTDNDSTAAANDNSNANASDSTTNNTADTTNDTTNAQANNTQQSQQTDQQASTDTTTGTTTDNSSTTTTDNSNSSAASYYTVQAGDNWFRIAYNNNLTTAQLKSMNGNVGTLTPGTTLRVK